MEKTKDIGYEEQIVDRIEIEWLNDYFKFFMKYLNMGFRYI